MRLSLACAVLALASCGGSGDGGTQPTAGTDVVSQIQSAATGMNYGLKIYLPPGYGSGAGRYPVIYAMDGEDDDGYSRYPVLRDALLHGPYNDRVILVAINSISGPRRFVDYPMPGAAHYYQFLTTELIPMIDAQYRTDPANRTLSGHSLSAEFVYFALYMEPPAHRNFSAFISEECTCWADSNYHYVGNWSVPATMQQQMVAASASLPVKFAASGDDQSNYVQSHAVYQSLVKLNLAGLQSQFRSYNLGHTGMDEPAFSDSLAFVFGPVHQSTAPVK